MPLDSRIFFPQEMGREDDLRDILRLWAPKGGHGDGFLVGQVSLKTGDRSIGWIHVEIL